MDEKDIQDLFTSLLSDPAMDKAPVREVFSLLVKSTLQYRDDMLGSKGVVVTVEDVRTCLKWLVPALATGTLPDLGNEIQMNLLRVWIETLKSQKTAPKHPESVFVWILMLGICIFFGIWDLTIGI